MDFNVMDMINKIKIKMLMVTMLFTMTPVRCTESQGVSTLAKATVWYSTLSKVPKYAIGCAVVGGVGYGVYKMGGYVNNRGKRKLENDFKAYERQQKEEFKNSFSGQLQEKLKGKQKPEKLGYISKAKVYVSGVWQGLKRNSWRVVGGIGVVIGCYFSYQRWGLEPVYNLGANILFRLVNLISKAPAKELTVNVDAVGNATRV